MEVGDMELKADDIAIATGTPRRTVLHWMTRADGMESYTPFGIRRYGRRTTVRKALAFLERANDDGYRVQRLRDWLKEKGMLPDESDGASSSGNTRTGVLDSEIS